MTHNTTWGRFRWLLLEDLRAALPRMGLAMLLGSLLGFVFAGGVAKTHIPLYQTQEASDGTRDVLIMQGAMHDEFFITMLVIGGLLFTALTWPALRRYRYRLTYLSLPVSRTHKWISQWLLCVLIYPVLFLLVYQFIIAPLLDYRVMKVMQDNVPEVAPLEVAPLRLFSYWMLEKWLIFWLAQGFFFWLAVRARRGAPLWAILVGQLSFLVLVTVGVWGLTWRPEAESYRPHMHTLTNGIFVASVLWKYMWGIMLVLGPMLYYLSWKELGEKEMVRA